MGAHQRIDRVARRSLKPHLSRASEFPAIREILHFEGKNGPDGIKRKSPGQDEPWHFIDPDAPYDSPLLVIIQEHIHNLAAALRATNHERAAFEAAWLAHAITDGLTPAHHFPFEEAVEELRGESMETRDTVRKKIIIPGRTKREQLVKNWKYWGAGGVMISHVGFEHGVSTVIGAQKVQPITLPAGLIGRLEHDGYEAIFLEMMAEIASLAMFDEFVKKGWTRKLAGQTRGTLMPVIYTAVTLAWLDALQRSKKA